MYSRFVLVMALVLAPLERASGQDLAFAQNYLAGSRQVISFPVGNPVAATVLGPQLDTLVGMAFDPGTAELRAINFTTQTLGIVNQATGAYVPTAVLQPPCCIVAFAIDPTRGTYYVSKADEFIYELNPVTGATTLLARGSAVGSQISALAVDCTGRMFASDGAVGGNLYRVDLAGNPTPVGVPDVSRPTSLAFDNRNGTLYGWFNLGSAETTSTHGVVDTVTAQVSQTSLLSGRYRMAVRNACSAAQLRLFGDGFES